MAGVRPEGAPHDDQRAHSEVPILLTILGLVLVLALLALGIGWDGVAGAPVLPPPTAV